MKCCICDYDSNVVSIRMSPLRNLNRIMFCNICEHCIGKQSVDHRICNFCSSNDVDMYIAYSTKDYRRINSCNECIKTIKSNLGLSNSETQLLELTEEDE